jgi:hypothetical protein
MRPVNRCNQTRRSHPLPEIKTAPGVNLSHTRYLKFVDAFRIAFITKKDLAHPQKTGDRHASVVATRLSIESVDPGGESVLASAACAPHQARRETSTDQCSHADRAHCAVATVRLARCAGSCESRDIDSLAPRRMEAVLEDEVSARAAAHSPRVTRADSSDSE